MSKKESLRDKKGERRKQKAWVDIFKKTLKISNYNIYFVGFIKKKSHQKIIAIETIKM